MLINRLPVLSRIISIYLFFHILFLSGCGAPVDSVDEGDGYSNEYNEQSSSVTYDEVDIDAQGWAVVDADQSTMGVQSQRCRNCGAAGTALADGILVKFFNSATGFNRQTTLSAAGCSQAATFAIAGGITHARVTGNQTINQALSSLARDPNVEFAEPNFILSSQLVPNDPRFNQLWGLNNTAAPAADVSGPEAWDVQTGTDVIVAVIDTGIRFNHGDLRNNIWINPNEIPNNGIDDDNNGYVDDWRGWDFVNNDNHPMDDASHGTHVSGTIAAEGNNNLGVVGVNWRARIMPLKFLDATGQGTTANAISAIEYAVANGAKVSNHSWGGTGFSTALSNALAAANAAGHLVVAASGNSGNNSDITPIYPAAHNLPNIISVAATTQTDGLATFSNFGPTSVDLGAPGVNIMSTLPNGQYGSLDGTSMAAPFVSGAAALLLAQNPSLTAADIKAALLSSVDTINSLSGTTVTGGRLNIASALASVAPAVSIAVTPVSSQLELGQNLQFNATGGTAPYSWAVNNPAVASINGSGLLTALSAGTVQVTVTDVDGNTGSSGTITITLPSITVAPTIQNIALGQVQQFNAMGGAMPYTWSVNNPVVASINANGLLTALAAGSVRVSATDANGVAGTSGVITVSIPTISVTPGNLNLAAGLSQQLSASGGAAPYAWSVANTSIANITANGFLTALAGGTTQITAVDANGIAGSTSVTVTQVTASPNSATIALGQTLQFTATDGVTPYSWSVNNTSVASINAISGLLTPTNIGSVVVTVTDNTGRSSSTGTISVVDTPVIAVPNAIMNLGSSQSLTVSGGLAPYTWSSSNFAIASITSNGLVSALAAGAATITVNDSVGNTNSTVINVRSVNVTSPTQSLVIGGAMQFTAGGGTAPYTWSVNNTVIASIDGNGLLTATAPGVVQVTATDADGFSGSSGNIAVNAVTITVTAPSSNVNTGSSLQFSASGGFGPYTWSVNNPGVATVDANGLLTPLASGSAVVTATDTNGNTGSSAVVTVSSVVIAITPNTANVNQFAWQRFSATGGTWPYTYSLGNPAAGFINSTSGWFRATGSVGATTTVIVTDADGNVSESGAVSVITACRMHRC